MALEQPCKLPASGSAKNLLATSSYEHIEKKLWQILYTHKLFSALGAVNDDMLQSITSHIRMKAVLRLIGQKPLNVFQPSELYSIKGPNYIRKTRISIGDTSLINFYTSNILQNKLTTLTITIFRRRRERVGVGWEEGLAWRSRIGGDGLPILLNNTIFCLLL